MSGESLQFFFRGGPDFPSACMCFSETLGVEPRLCHCICILIFLAMDSYRKKCCRGPVVCDVQQCLHNHSTVVGIVIPPPTRNSRRYCRVFSNFLVYMSQFFFENVWKISSPCHCSLAVLVLYFFSFSVCCFDLKWDRFPACNSLSSKKIAWFVLYCIAFLRDLSAPLALFQSFYFYLLSSFL